jgi:hypothetical protein
MMTKLEDLMWFIMLRVLLLLMSLGLLMIPLALLGLFLA